jgi:hypothetical protein
LRRSTEAIHLPDGACISANDAVHVVPVMSCRVDVAPPDDDRIGAVANPRLSAALADLARELRSIAALSDDPT